MLTRDERAQAIKFQDAIGEVVDEYLRQGMKPDIIRDVFRDETTHLEARRAELASGTAVNHPNS